MEHLLLYRWPGNVRQLQNEMRRMVALAEPERDAARPHAHLAGDPRRPPTSAPEPGQRPEMAVPLARQAAADARAHRTRDDQAALRDHHGKVDAAARALGISRKGLYLKRQRLGL